ncbi:5249_t:CDS:2 [Paraglomus brasilianum]|uniref:5249_t:CDS:1 n=1 Tax=Paraglomus brasilianum TaxID=144538 RepID=A0A9N9GN97_9GLOM|nr:5249_t:CDS:2 [Paraglomus brasilianum]
MSSVKLATLLVRTLAKPIANSIKEYSKNHRRFREACISFAQATHRLEMKLKMNLLGQKSAPIRPLKDAKAVEMGANFVGETIVFGVASGLIIWEQRRSYKSNRDKYEECMKSTEELKKQLQKEIEQLRKERHGDSCSCKMTQRKN